MRNYFKSWTTLGYRHFSTFWQTFIEHLVCSGNKKISLPLGSSQSAGKDSHVNIKRNAPVSAIIKMCRKCFKSLQSLERMRLAMVRGISQRWGHSYVPDYHLSQLGLPISLLTVARMGVLALCYCSTTQLVHSVGFRYLYTLILALYLSKHCFPSLFSSNSGVNTQIISLVEWTNRVYK